MKDTTILVDAGLSCMELERRMGAFGIDPSSINELLITHEHTDHVRGARRFCLKHDVTAYATDGTLSLTPLDGVRRESILRNSPFEVEGVLIQPFPVRHFAAEPVAFTLSAEGAKLGIASDLGCATARVEQELRGSRVLLVEANYDDAMLMNGSYPDFLKRTIRSSHGHLSNKDSGSLSAKVVGPQTKEVVLLHLSRDNNTPQIAAETVTSALRSASSDARVSTTEHGGTNGPKKL